MGENSKISWTNHTFNPWWGCTKIAAGCENCYAENLGARFGTAWGPIAERRHFGAKHWAEPLAWNRRAAEAGRRDRVFCGSMCDVGEDRRDLDADRTRLWKLIEETRNLDWLLLTKRPAVLGRLLPTIQIGGEELPRFDNVWIGTSVCTQADADKNIPELLRIPAAVRFISVEPCLDAIDLQAVQMPDGDCLGTGLDNLGGTGTGIDWVIIGGESGPRARPCNVEWVRSLVRQCKAAGVPVFVKQLGANAIGDDYDLSDETVRWLDAAGCELYESARLPLRDRAGSDPSEWSADLRIRETPKVMP